MLSDATAKLVENYLSRYRSYAVGTDPLITNRYQHKIDRDGISYIVKKYADALRKEDAAISGTCALPYVSALEGNAYAGGRYQHHLYQRLSRT